MNVVSRTFGRVPLAIVFGFRLSEFNLESLLERNLEMKRIISSTLALGLLGICCIGCDQKATVKEEKTITTPGGKTTVTTETDVKKSGDHKDDAPK